MKLNIRYFGKLTDITKCTDEVITELSAKSLTNVIENLYSKYPGLKNTTHTIFVNNKKASLDNSILAENDEIVLMPPFSGG
jgi:molybdopterin converting factor small subunit